jgi:glycosyltransferase involved in cell wall biosynthesis
MEFFPKVSIIMPTYNRAALIMETVNSVLAQTYSNWELIIVDDGSDDNTEEIVSNIDKRILYFKIPRSGIGGKTKNLGMEKTSGELIAFIDSDDLWATQKIEKQVEALKEYPNAGFCLTGGLNFRNNLEPVDHFYKKTEGLKYDNLFIDCFRSEVTAFTQTLMVRKSCVLQIGKFKEEKSFSDVEFIYDLAYHFKGLILYESLVYRRLHNANYITPNWEKSCYEGIDIINSYRDKLPVDIWRNALFRAYTNFGEKSLRYKHRAKAFQQYLKAWSYNPLSLVPVKKLAKTILYSLKRK